MRTPPIRVLFVCLGNICRSPLAHGVFADVVAQRGLSDVIGVDSAGTGAWHVGNQPDPRSIAVAAQHGIDLTDQRARKVALDDFTRFDLIIGMDESNIRDLNDLAPAKSTARIERYLPYALGVHQDIDDPYYGGDEGFETAYQLIRSASEALVAKLETGDGPRRP